MTYRRVLAVLMMVIFVGLTLYAETLSDCKSLAKEANKEIRAVENMRDKAVAQAKIGEIRSIIDKIRSLDPNYVELTGLETKYRRLVSIYGGPSASPQAETGKQAEPVNDSAKQQALSDWENIVQVKKEFLSELEPIIPTYVKNVIYTESNVDQVVAKISELQKKAPEVKKNLEVFRSKYGKTSEEINDKMQELTPKDSRKSMLDPVNQRPNISAGACYEELLNGLTNLDEAPKLEAKRVLTGALQNLDLIESFILDTERDKRYQGIEKKIQMGLKFNPADTELKLWMDKIKQLRQKSKADIEKALESATFPKPVANFAGPGNPDELVDSLIKFFNESDPSQKTIAVSIAGNWVSAKQNIFGETIQWGLPVWAASIKNDSQEIARVFRLTVLTREEYGISKSPPWTGSWVGDSYRMHAKNIKGH